jgi:hypothetical protein
MATFPRQQLERLRHVPGQDLLARDFRAQAAIESQLRWWHNRALHAAYGVREGLQALPLREPPLTVEVQPGVAYDPYGRELVLAGVRHLAAPDAKDGADLEPLLLVLRYVEPAAAGLPVCDDLGRGRAGNSAGADTAELAWLAEAGWRPADGVPLARLLVGPAGLAWDAAFLSPFAQPLSRPRIASGATLAGGTAWVPWQAPLRERAAELGFLVWVDTRAAGFTRPPCYFAWLSGTLDGATVPPIAVLDFVGRTFLHGFYFHIRPRLMPTAAPPGLAGETPLAAAGGPTFSDFWRLARQQLAVSWLGIEMRPGSGRPARLQPEVSDELKP